MSPAPASAPSYPTPTTAAPVSSSPTAPLSFGLAVGLVVCPIAFIFIVVAFWRVSRRGNMFARLPTARLQREQAQRRRDYAKFMARGAVSLGQIISRSPRANAGETGSPLPPMDTLAPPPPVYTRGPTLPPYERWREV